VHAEVSAVRDADRVVGLLGDRVKITLIVNVCARRLSAAARCSRSTTSTRSCAAAAGVIADEPGVIVSTNKGEPIALDAASPTGDAYRKIAGRIAGTDTSTPEIRAKHLFSTNCSGASGNPCSSFLNASSIRTLERHARETAALGAALRSSGARADVVESLKPI